MTVLYQLQCITIDEVVDVCKSLKNNKSTGLDNISYEHVTLQKHLCSLFTLIISNCYIPICWKSSVIIPLFKGGNKVKNDPNAVVYQRFLRKCYHSFDISTTKFPHVSQMAYQKSLCSTHAYFNVKEMTRHYTERHSTMFVVLLDSMKAFDSVWHDALLLKLYKYNTHGKLWLLIDEMYRNMQSCIMFSNNLSRWFPLERGVREGGVLSAILYLVFINDLLINLDNAKCGAMLLRVSSSVQADDIALLSPTVNGMQTLRDRTTHS